MIKKKIKKWLIANRGEIACKIIKCAKNLDIPTVAIYSNEDADSLHIQLADEAVNIPGSLVSETYMNGPAIISTCKKYRANAVTGWCRNYSSKYLFYKGKGWRKGLFRTRKN